MPESIIKKLKLIETYTHLQNVCGAICSREKFKQTLRCCIKSQLQKLSVVILYCFNNFIATSCGYCDELKCCCKYLLKILCDINHLSMSSSSFQ